MGDTESPPLRRPNGRLQACDPCRSRKVACDHTRPVCTRCRKNEIDTQCVYTSTVSRTKYSRRSRRDIPTPDATPNLQPVSASSNSRENSATVSQSTTVSQPAHVSRPSARNSSPAVESSPGFLGYMSHNAVFEETKRSLSLLHAPNSERAAPPRGRGHARAPVSFQNLPEILREMCLFVLRRLPGQSQQKMVWHDIEPWGWTDVLVAKVIHSLENNFGLDVQRQDSDLEQIAEVICINTTKPLRDIQSSSEWMDQFTGPNLRWEALGLTWAYLEGISSSLEALNKRSLAWLPGKKSAETSLLCMSYCIDVSCRLNQGNVLLLDMVRRKAALQSMISGDAGFDCWTTHGLAVSMATYLGLHTLTNPPGYQPCLGSEYKRVVFAQVFIGDKGVSFFTGRPPQISLRHCSTPLPLDISEQELMAGGTATLRARERLDENDWNTAGYLNHVTLLRAQCFLGRILDEVCEITLTNDGVTTLDHLLSLKQRHDQTVAQFPEFLRYSPSDWEALDPHIHTIYAKLTIHLVGRRIDFMIERLLLRNGASNEGDLLVTSFDLVTSTLVFWTHKDKFAPMRRNFDWLVMAYAAPGGGILCQELLKPTFRGAHPKAPELTRSNIIQRLSLLVGFLDWIQPPNANADLCSDCKQIIQRVLDHHLNAETSDGGNIDTFDWNFNSQLDFDFNLLDTYDWLRTEYL